MEFEVREVPGPDGAAVIEVRGELDLATVGELRRRLDASNGARATVVDLSGCSFIDSTGVSLIVRTSQRADGDGGAALVLVAEPESQVRRALRLTNLDSRIPVLGSREAALATLPRGP